MIDIIGRKIAIVQSSDPGVVGLRGVFALETMKTITVLSGNEKRVVPKRGTVFQVHDSGKLVVADDMLGRVEERLARGAKV
jgi:RNase P/RNase MRP subunit p29